MILGGPRISLDEFPLDGETRFCFIWWNLIFRKKKDLESPLIFVLFLNGKQNKKEKP